MLDDIDREAMRESKAISKLRGFQGSRDRSRHEKIQTATDEQFQQAWKSIKEKQ